MTGQNVPFIVRRARLLLGMTQAEFAMLYGVDETAVAQWEGGLGRPNHQIWERLRNLTLRASSSLDDRLVRASPIYKYIVDMKDLTRPVVASKGILEALEAVGASKDMDPPAGIAELSRNSPNYKVSGVHALEIIQSDPRWLRGDVVYGEVHCVAVPLGNVWIDGMIAPLPDRLAALLEFAPSRRGAAEGFRVHLVQLQDPSFNRPGPFG
ncbi:MAG: helix-turn-helix transcriptional regulator [Rhodomicrobium sp.]